MQTPLPDDDLPVSHKKRRSPGLRLPVAGLGPLDANFAELPLLIKRPNAQQIFDRSRKWFERREARGELTPVKKDQGVVYYRREELLRAVGLLDTNRPKPAPSPEALERAARARKKLREKRAGQARAPLTGRVA